jgi:hypothetical protein
MVANIALAAAGQLVFLMDARAAQAHHAAQDIVSQAHADPHAALHMQASNALMTAMHIMQQQAVSAQEIMQEHIHAQKQK